MSDKKIEHAKILELFKQKFPEKFGNFQEDFGDKLKVMNQSFKPMISHPPKIDSLIEQQNREMMNAIINYQQEITRLKAANEKLKAFANYCYGFQSRKADMSEFGLTKYNDDSGYYEKTEILK